MKTMEQNFVTHGAQSQALHRLRAQRRSLFGIAVMDVPPSSDDPFAKNRYRFENQQSLEICKVRNPSPPPRHAQLD